ncbi:tyrosine-type recombinase/integrase [Cellulomonas marina]|uniref:Site-specific recombinase XerD n=1 Tax=Cellulomonas marina TaxID=988821 RepID=A0A1I1B0C5_9CELL|nr:tyrosine-type recombinase/integrase [Cellulomonas marina]SFB42108.1 Site-specific recombinase XerD [Cellulomonas marina]
MDEYKDYLVKAGQISNGSLQQYARFVAAYPTFDDWLAQPLEQRLGRLRGEGRRPSHMTNGTSYSGRQYLMYASMTGRLKLPWDYLIMLQLRGFAQMATVLGHEWLPAHMEDVIEKAVAQGWSKSSAGTSISFLLPRFVLRHADPHYIKGLTALDFETFRGEVRDVYATASPESNTKWRAEDRRMGRGALSAAFGAHAIHFQLGLVTDGPVRTRPEGKLIESDVAPGISEAIERWLQYDSDRGTPDKTLRNHDLHLRYFTAFVAENLPTLHDLSGLERAHIIDYIGWLAKRKQLRDKSLALTPGTRRSALGTLAKMLREVAENDLGPAPGRELIHKADYPKPQKALPRFIPKRELELLVKAMADLKDPYQRCSLLVARWSGARSDEIKRLELDCLDTYADGTYRLRIPIGKTGKERSVPLANEAAYAIQAVQALRANDRDAGKIDRVTKRRVRYLFMYQGRHLSKSFLFDIPLQAVCEQAGLLTAEGGRLVTAHRFRHTLGTNLVEAGARWRTIMAILGHETSDMTLTYAHISDPEVKADYEKVVLLGSAIAGPAATKIRNKELSTHELDWLQSNFFKSEMELGGCIRLPEEGPCECDMFLACPKFFTTKSHAPRLRRRWHREEELIHDARERGWPREVERHRAIQVRIEKLLADLGESLEGPDEAC